MTLRNVRMKKPIHNTRIGILAALFAAMSCIGVLGFTNVTIVGLAEVLDSSVAWGDYDNDGRLDFLITGQNGSNSGVSQLWRNTGSGFTNVTDTVTPGLPGVYSSSVAWGDYDNDGWLDFLFTGSYVSQLWRNTGSGFTNITDTVTPGLPGVHSSSVVWGDFDNDGRLDFLITGSIGFSGISQLWRNTGNGFTNITASVAPGLPGVSIGSVAWGDYDNDGRLDFLITGYNQSNPISQIWRNTGSGFMKVTPAIAPGLPGFGLGSMVWGDYDNDGRLDFLITGWDGNGGISQLWRNTGSGFTNITASIAIGLPGVNYSSVAWGDYDNDGRLDFLLTGSNASQLWRNIIPVTNTPPTAPTGLLMTASTNAVMFSWNSAVDGQTSTTGLTYNIRAGSKPGGTDLVAAHVTTTNGFRRVPTMGNAMLRHNLPLTGLTNGQTVYWSVQAVDTSFAGGPFAIETSVVTIPVLNIQRSTATNPIVSWTPPTFGWHLQERTNLSVGTWSISPSGELNPVSVPATNAAKFYRLNRP